MGIIITLWLIYFGVLYYILRDSSDKAILVAIVLFVVNIILSVVIWLLSIKKVKEAEELARIHKQHAIERAQKQMEINQKKDALRATVNPRAEYWEKKREQMGDIPLDDVQKFD